MGLHIVLVEPEIPQNTGNIARTCAAANAELHLVHPLGFSTDEKQVRRAGLDYWNMLKIHHYPNLPDFLTTHKDKNLFFISTKAPKSYHEHDFPADTWLLFGKESKGLPEDLLSENLNRTFRIPMHPDARSLNLSNAVAIVAYEVLRQNDYSGLQLQGKLGI